MNQLQLQAAGKRKIDGIVARANATGAAPARRARRRISTLGVLYAHALALEHEAEACYREFASHMADCGNDAVADLFLRLADFEAQHAYRLAKKSVGIEIAAIDPGEYAWIDSGAPLPDARAFVFRMMTPRLALEIALRAEQRTLAFFGKVQIESRNAAVRRLAAEFARDEQSHIDWVREALACLPPPYLPDEQLAGDPTIEQMV